MAMTVHSRQPDAAKEMRKVSAVIKEHTLRRSSVGTTSFFNFSMIVMTSVTPSFSASAFWSDLIIVSTSR